MDMVRQKSWEDFRASGLLWLVNQTLHVFGWAIVIEMKDGKATWAYPARTSFRGFSEENNDAGYKAVTEYMKNNVDELIEEV